MHRVHSKLIFFLFLLSGACGLIYEIVWVRMLGLLFGNTTYAVSTILAVFMGGLAFGSWYFGKIVDRTSHRTSPLKIYALLEAAIALYCITTPLLFKAVKYIFMQSMIGRPDITAVSILLMFVLTALVLVLPTVCMGGTLPVITSYFASVPGEEKSSSNVKDIGWNVGMLYSLNTWGACFGALLCGFILIELLGIYNTLFIAAGVNAGIAIFVYFIIKKIKQQGSINEEPEFHRETNSNSKTIVSSHSIFPHASLWEASIGDTIVVAKQEKFTIDFDEFKVKTMIVQAQLQKIGLENPIHLLAKFIMGEKTIPHMISDSPLNTDARPFVEFSASRSLYDASPVPDISRVLREKREPATTYMSNFEGEKELMQYYVDEGLYGPAEKMLDAYPSTERSSHYYNMRGFMYVQKGEYA